jgi:hypothetical protein
MAQTAPNSSEGGAGPFGTGASANGFFNFNVNAGVDFTGTEAQIVVNDQATTNVDENLTFSAYLTAASMCDAFRYKQTNPNAAGGVAEANEITLSLSGGYDQFKTDLWEQLKVHATGDNGVARAESLGDYVVSLVAWAVFGSYKAVAPIVNDQELTQTVDGDQAQVADKIALAMITHNSGDLTSGDHSLLKGDLSSCPLGDVLSTMIKYHPNRFQVNDVSDYKPVPFVAGDIISFTTTLENLKVVENVDTSVAYLKAAKNLPYDASINSDGYLIGGVMKDEASPANRKWVVGVKITLQ